MEKALLKEFIKGGVSTVFMVIKTSPKLYGELLVECDTLKEARAEQKAFKGKTVIIKSEIKAIK